MIRENLATWRFQPGKPVLVDASHPYRVSLAAAPDDRLYLAWTASQPAEELVIVASSADGEAWETEVQFHRGHKRGRDTVAIAANQTAADHATPDSVAVAWVREDRCYAARKTASGEWTAPEAIPGRARLLDIGLAATGDGGFSLVAVPMTDADTRHALISNYRPEQGWSRLSPIRYDARVAAPHLGYREGLGLLAVGRDGQLVAGTAHGWEALFPLPCHQWHLSSLLIRPNTAACALIRTYAPVSGGASLITSHDLQAWSDPLFLGWLDPLDQTTAVARAGGRTYVARAHMLVIPSYRTHFLERFGQETPSGTKPIPIPARDESSDRFGPRVFQIDDSLTRDTDEDGLTDITEEWLLTDYQNPDTDGDGDPDGTDLDPLAATAPDNLEARLQQLVFAEISWRIGVGSPPPSAIIITEQREPFPSHATRFICLTPAEAQAYRKKYGWWTLPEIGFSEPEFSPDGRRATIGWSYREAFLCGHGSTVTLDKIDGTWVVVSTSLPWIS